MSPPGLPSSAPAARRGRVAGSTCRGCAGSTLSLHSSASWGGDGPSGLPATSLPTLPPPLISVLSKTVVRNQAPPQHPTRRDGLLGGPVPTAPFSSGFQVAVWAAHVGLEAPPTQPGRRLHDNMDGKAAPLNLGAVPHGGGVPRPQHVRWRPLLPQGRGDTRWITSSSPSSRPGSEMPSHSGSPCHSWAGTGASGAIEL